MADGLLAIGEPDAIPAAGKATFDYGTVDPKSADRLREISRKIRVLDSVACVQIGSELAEAQKELNSQGIKGEGFQKWIVCETPYGKQAAYDLINIYNKSKADNFVQLIGQGFSQTILARLSAPSTPDSVIEKAREVAESGGTLTVAQVEEMKRQAKAEARAEMEAEKAAIAQRSEDWRQQAIGAKHALTEAEQKLRSAQTETATLRRTIASEAERLAEARIAEIKAQLSADRGEREELKKKLASLKREREDAIQRGVSNKLREQQSEIDQREAQLVSLERRIALLRAEMEPLDRDAKASAHHRSRIEEADRHINAIAVLVGDAFDPDFADAPPAEILREWERGAAKLLQLVDAIRGFIGRAEETHA